MKTEIFKTYADFRNRENKETNGVSEDFSKENPNYEKQNETNEGCWNCSRCAGCSRCADCADCARCSRCADCADCADCFDLKNASPIESNEKYKYPKIENIHSKLLEAVTNTGKLKMDDWHADESMVDGAYCGTTHCRAGWIVALAGKEGVELEKKTSTLHAAMQIYWTSSPNIRVSPTRFFESNEIAMADIKRCAELEKSQS